MARKAIDSSKQSANASAEPADEVLDAAAAFAPADAGPAPGEAASPDEVLLVDDEGSGLVATADDFRDELDIMLEFDIQRRQPDESLARWFRANVSKLDAFRESRDVDYALLASRLLFFAGIVDGDGNAITAQRAKQMCSDARREIEIDIETAERRARGAEREASSIRLVISRDLEPALRLIAPDLSPSAAATLAIERTAVLVDKERRESPSDEVVALLSELVDGENATRKAVEECSGAVAALIEEMKKPPQGPHPLEAKIDALAKTFGDVMGAFTVRLERVEGLSRSVVNLSEQIKEAVAGLTAEVKIAGES